MLFLGQLAEVRPIVRSFSSLARVSKFDLDCHIADARDREALVPALKGCDIALISVAGDLKVIVDCMEPIYKAAEQAQIRRLIYLSTASVHGQAPLPGTDETTPLSEDQPLPYNRAKVKAENTLMALQQDGAVEVVVLRPGIVTGPRSSRWVQGIADELLEGKAYLINDGAGICNSIYVDNLVNGIYLAMIRESQAVSGQVFLLGDQERVTWLDLYGSIASALGIDPSTIARVDTPRFGPSWRQTIDEVRASAPAQKILPVIPGRLKRIAKAAIFEAIKSDTGGGQQDGLSLPQVPNVTQEMVLLQSCTYKLPHTKAERLLGYQPPVTFSEGMRRSISWLSFADYPIPNVG